MKKLLVIIVAIIGFVTSHLRKYEINTLLTDSNKLNLDVQVDNLNKISNYANTTANRYEHSTAAAASSAHDLKRSVEQTKYWSKGDIRDLAIKNIKITNEVNKENNIKYYG